MVFESFLTIISDFMLMILSVLNTFIFATFSMNVFLDLSLGHILIVVIVFTAVYAMIFGGGND